MGRELESLNKIYAKRSIEAIEKEALGACQLSLDHRQRFIEVLWYLRHSNRFKENPQFKSSTFDQYVKARFGITEVAFDLERRAFFQYGDKVDGLGMGIVKKVLAQVPAPMHVKALEQIRRVSTTPGSPPLWDVAKEVIKRHRKKHVVMESPVQEPDPATNVGKIDKSREIIAQLKQEIRELKAQRDKLIKANGELKKQIAVYEAALNAGMQRSVRQALAG